MMVRRTICRMAGQGKTARQTLAKLRSLTNVLSREDLVVPSLTTIECVREDGVGGARGAFGVWCRSLCPRAQGTGACGAPGGRGVVGCVQRGPRPRTRDGRL